MKYVSLSLLSVALLAGCNATAPTIGNDSARTAATGSAGGANAENANKQLERCDRTLGTLAVVEDTNAAWYAQMQSYQLRSTTPVLRMLVQQSNCFVVPPMKFAYDACKCLEVAVHGGMPVLLLSAGQAGATAPAAIAALDNAATIHAFPPA